MRLELEQTSVSYRTSILRGASGGAPPGQQRLCVDQCATERHFRTGTGQDQERYALPFPTFNSEVKAGVPNIRTFQALPGWSDVGTRRGVFT